MALNQLKDTVSYAAAGMGVSVFLGWLPQIAALFTIVWLGMQMVEKVVGRPFAEIIRDVIGCFKRK